MKSFIIRDLDQFESFVDSNFNDIEYVAFDIETDGVEEVKAKVWGVGLAFEADEGFYLPLRDQVGNPILNEERVVGLVNNLLSKKKVLTHNGVFDTLVWYHRYGVRHYDRIFADTILMKHMLDEEPPFGLKEIAVAELGEWADKAQQAMIDSVKANGGSVTKTNFEMWRCDTDILGEYCAHDVMLTRQLFDKFHTRIEKEGLSKLFYEEEVMPLYREVTIPMKERGIVVDTEMFKKLSKEADQDAHVLTKEIFAEIGQHVDKFEEELLNDLYPVKSSGNFPKAYAKYLGLELTSTAKKVIDAIEPTNPHLSNFKNWMQGRADLIGPIKNVQRAMFRDKHPEQESVFNLSSKHHLKWLFFECLQESPLSTTEKGEPQVDDDFLESISQKYAWVRKLRDLNTIIKIKGTYLDGLVDRSVDGILYTSFLQFGTTSGRFASRNPNLQNCPAPISRKPEEETWLSDKYVNAIRYGLQCRPGNKMIGADFSSLEPHIAAYVSNDPGLIDIFVNNKDFYSAIAIKQFNLTHLSPFKDDPNYLGDKDKATRNKTKTYSLATFYGASGYRIAEVIKCSVEEANALIEGYLDAFPGIRTFIDKAHHDACTKGYVATVFGRVRHLKECKNLYDTYGYNLLDPKWARKRGLSEERSKFKNLMNNAVNFQIQGTAGHVMNRAMLLTTRKFKELGIDGHILMTVHDEQILEVREDQAEEASSIVKWAMENAVNLDPIKLKATPILGYSYGECK